MSLFLESNYKDILKNLVLKTGERGPLKRLADYLGVNPSLISQVLSGPKDFTEEQTVLVCEFLGLSKVESRYVLTLVQIARAGSVKLRRIHEESLASIRSEASDLANRVSNARELTDAEKTRFYSSWIYAAIQLCSTLEKPPTFKNICDRFHLNSGDAQAIVSFLIEIGLIIEDRGHYKTGANITHLERSSPYLPNLHRAWRLKAVQQIDTLRDEEMMYTCNFSVSRADFAKIREQFLSTIETFLKTAQASPAEDIAQFNLDLFWVRG